MRSRVHPHREKQPTHGLFNACVARPVKPAELKVNTEVRKATQTEWDRLRQVTRPDGSKGVWDEGGVREWADVHCEARQQGCKVNVGLRGAR